jgi:hypothetical protein
VKETWYLQPPEPGVTPMTETLALVRARGERANAPASALLVPYRDAAAANAALAANATVHPDRMVWVVTVDADVMTAGSFGVQPRLKHMYSVIIDSETGGVTDSCVGCEAVRDGQLVVVPIPQGADLSHDPTAGPSGPRQDLAARGAKSRRQ